MNLHSWIVPAVTATVGIVCWVAAAVIWLIGNRHTPRLVVALAITGGVGILSTPVGHWLHSVADNLNVHIAALTGRLFGEAVGFIGAAIVAYFVAHRVWQRRIDDRVVLASAALPIVVTFIPGVAGDAVTAVVFGVANAVGWAVGSLF